MSSDRVRVSLSEFSEVLNAAPAGNGWAFDHLFRTWNGPVTGFVRARGVADVDGVVNDVFLRAFRSMSSFTGDESGFRAWLFTIARNRVIDEVRRAGRSLTTVNLDAATAIPGGDVSVDADRRFSTDRVVALLGLLDRRTTRGAYPSVCCRLDHRADCPGHRAPLGCGQATAAPSITPTRAGIGA